MDILTQAVLGAATACAFAPSTQRRLAAGIGLFAGVLPDFDALIQSGNDPLLVLDYHRHFSHALAFVPIGALIAALLLWPWLRKHLGFRRIYAYSLTGYALSGLLDACTSYGTHLWLPFSDAKAAWNLIAVVDPIFTLLLMIPLWISLRRPASTAIYWGFALAAAYLGMGYLQQQRATEAATRVAESRGHLPQQLTVKPTLANLILWRTLYRHDGQIYADAVHVGWSVRHYPGETAPLLGDTPPERAVTIERFSRFADGWLIATPSGLIGDARYAMLPTSLTPIWGIRWTTNGQVEFVSDHSMTKEMRQRWLGMLTGQHGAESGETAPVPTAVPQDKH